MMTVTILAVGRLGEQYWIRAAGEYIKRLGAFCRLHVEEVPEYRLPQRPSPAEISRAMEEEGRALLKKLPPRTKVFPLCVEGDMLSSEELGAALEKAAGEYSRIAFLIGGSHGLSEEVKARCGRGVSMSPMTFPHQLARVMLLEQLYRAFSIGAGMQYHK